MLSLKKKRTVLSVLAATVLVIPVSVLAANKINSSEDTYAATMPASFRDQNFYNCVLAEFQKEFPNETVAATGLTDAQLAKIGFLSCHGDGLDDSEKISDVSGLEKMQMLTQLYLYYNKIRQIDLSANTRLYNLQIAYNELESLDTSNAPLTGLNVSYNNISSLTIRASGILKTLLAAKNKLSSLNMNGFTELETLDVSENELESLDVRNNTKLKRLDAYKNMLSSIDLGANGNLEHLNLSNNELTSLNVNNKAELKNLIVNYNQLSSLNVSTNTNLEYLSLMNNKLKSLNVGDNAKLEWLRVDTNKLSSLDVSANENLEHLSVSNNDLSSLDVSENSKLVDLDVDDIFVSAGLEKNSLSGNQGTFNLSALGFISEEGNATIANTGSYTYNDSSKILTVTDLAATKGFVRVSPIDDSKADSEYKNYKLAIGEIKEDEEEDDDGGGKDDGGEDDGGKDDGGKDESGKQEDESDKKDKEDIVVPNTSVAGKPNTGANTSQDNNDGGGSVLIYGLPIVILGSIMIYYRYFGKNKRRKFEF